MGLNGFYGHSRRLKFRFIFVLFLAAAPQVLMADNCALTISRISQSTFSHDEGERKAFTLIELGVVVVIIGTLVAILLPSLAGARHAGRDVKCLSNLKQDVMLAQIYAQDHKDILPVDTIDNSNPPNVSAGVNFGTAFEITDGIRNAFTCPEDKGFAVPSQPTWLYHSYSYRGLEAMLRQTPPIIFQPRRAVRRYEWDQDHNVDYYYRLPIWNDVYGFHESKKGPAFYEDGQRNAGYWDGHSQRIPMQRRNPTEPLPTPMP